MTPTPLEALVESAREGDRAALEELVRAIQDRLYRLALRMTGVPAEAEDATQEILVKIVTRLASFRGECAFTTWCHRVAVNHLLQAKRRGAERGELSFEKLGEVIDAGIAGFQTGGQAEVHEAILSTEVRLSCTQSMLDCVDREHRLAFILSDILEVSGEEGAEILGIEPAAFRKRVSRARAEVVAFMKGRCGVYDPEAPCRCRLQVPVALKAGALDPRRLPLARHPARGASPELEEVAGLLDVGAIYRRAPPYAAPEGFVEAIKALLCSGRALPSP